jgi:hypothetical protein
MKHIHLPLTEEVHAALMDEAQRRNQPATALAREAVERLIFDAKRQATESELEAYIRVEAGGPHDLDEALERAGVEHLLETR